MARRHAAAHQLRGKWRVGDYSALGKSVASIQFAPALISGPNVLLLWRDSRREHGFEFFRRLVGMATTIDHLRVDHHVIILREFTDATGVTLRAGERGILRGQAFDQRRQEIQLEIERAKGRVALRFPLKAPSGPRIGHMKEFFELGDYAPVPGAERPRLVPAARKMIVPTALAKGATNREPDWLRQAASVEGPDRLEAMEQQIQREAQHIGGAASIAEMYAQRMRAFQRAGNETRAVAAFKLAVQWMWTYAGQATSGGEGEALSLERDEFHAALVREFGYDPTTDAR